VIPELVRLRRRRTDQDDPVADEDVAGLPLGCSGSIRWASSRLSSVTPVRRA
jgi:hypothetical protein